MAPAGDPLLMLSSNFEGSKISIPQWLIIYRLSCTMNIICQLESYKKTEDGKDYLPERNSLHSC